MCFKHTIILTILSAILAVNLVSSQSHSTQFGFRVEGDYLLSSTIQHRELTTLSIVTKDVSFPPEGQINDAVITFINITDAYLDGSGGYASLLAGGVNYNHTKIHLTSQRGHCFNFLIEIYGK